MFLLLFCLVAVFGIYVISRCLIAAANDFELPDIEDIEIV